MGHELKSLGSERLAHATGVVVGIAQVFGKKGNKALNKYAQSLQRSAGQSPVGVDSAAMSEFRRRVHASGMLKVKEV